MNIAVMHPGKIGDLLWATPTMWALRLRHHEAMVDIFTSSYCKDLVPFLEYQDGVRKVIIPDSYKVEHYGQGVQPWRIDIANANEYEAVYQLGMQHWPETDMISYYSRIVEVEPTRYYFQYPDSVDGLNLGGNILVIAKCRKVGYKYHHALIEQLRDRVRIIEVGWVGDDPFPGVENDNGPLKFNFLDTAALFGRAKVFAGGLGANTVLAAGFDTMKSVVVLPELGFDHRHPPRLPYIKYMKNPQVDEFVLEVRRALGV